jgi:hypothetical protein
MIFHPLVLAIGITLSMLALMLALIEVGYRYGRRRQSRYPGESGEIAAAVVAAVLGLLGLVLAFTFSSASERLTIRRAQVVDEANAIGTAYLRVDLLAPADQPAIRALFRDYVEVRIETFERILDRPTLSAEVARGHRIQSEIWSRSVTACAHAPNPAASILLLAALNQMIDITTTRAIATVTHVPLLILGLLVFLSSLGALLAGDTLAYQGRRNPLHTVLFALAIASTVYVIIDLEYPRAGLITVGAPDRAMVELRNLVR